MDSIKISIPFIEILTNENIQKLAMSSLLLGANVEKTEDGITTYSKVKNNYTSYSVLTFEVCSYILSLGGEIKNYHTYIEINPADVVPTGIRGSIIYDDQENEVNVTWNQWVHSNKAINVINNSNFISSYSHYAGFRSIEKPEKCLTFSEIQILLNEGYNVLNKSQYLNLLEGV